MRGQLFPIRQRGAARIACGQSRFGAPQDACPQLIRAVDIIRAPGQLPHAADAAGQLRPLRQT